MILIVASPVPATAQKPLVGSANRLAEGLESILDLPLLHPPLSLLCVWVGGE